MSVLDSDGAVHQADWHVRYALDRLESDPRLFHPGVQTHLKAAGVQLVAALDCLLHDQVDPSSPGQ